MMRFEQFDDVNLAMTPIDGDGSMSRRDAERDAVARLVKHCFGADAAVGHAEAGAPFVVGRDVSLSVSHSRRFAAVAWSERRTVGVDIEEPREQVERVAPRVFSAGELAAYADELLTAWTLKEALYKAALTAGVDFRSEICLPAMPFGSPDSCVQTATVRGRIFRIVAVVKEADFVLSLVASDEKTAKKQLEDEKNV